MPTVAVTDFVSEPLDVERKILGDLADVVALNAVVEADLAGKVENVDCLMMYHFLKVGERTIRNLSNCRLIIRCGVGIDNVDWRCAAERGIPVANVPDYGTEEVADAAIAHLLAFLRGTHILNSRLQRGEGAWSYDQVQPLGRIRGQTLGLVGIGRIGTAAALRAKALGFHILFHDPYAPDGIDKALGISRVETLAELLAESDAISLHCPLTQETHHLIDDAALAAMKPGAYLVNTARGGVVDAAAVLRAIESGRLAGAGLDVLETEPPNEDDPLVRAWRDPSHPAHDRVVLNPHSAFYSEEGLMDMRVKGAENCRRVLLGEAPRNVVNGVWDRDR